MERLGRTDAARAFALDPVDSLFFRSGQPFNQDDPGQARAASVFPPFPPTVIGALRAAFARGRGWSRGEWPDAIKKILGDRADLGSLRFGGPCLIRDGKRLFPAPALLVGRRKNETDARDRARTVWSDITRLAPPLGETLRTDLGLVALPRLPPEPSDLKPLKGVWLTRAGLEAVLAGGVPALDDLVAEKDLWAVENRIGIARDPITGTVLPGQLYAAAHIRLRRGVRLVITVHGLPGGWLPANPAPFGGEHRMAWIEEVTGDVDLRPPAPPAAPPAGTALLTVITTGLTTVRDRSDRLIGDGIPVPGTLLSACLDRPIAVGGWDTSDLRPGPRPLEPFLPPGSVWFINPSDPGTPAPDGVLALGERTGWGFGEAVAGYAACSIKDSRDPAPNNGASR